MMRSLMVLLITLAMIAPAAAHIPVKTERVNIVIVTGWDNYRNASFAISDLGLEARIRPADDIARAVSEELEGDAMILVVDHLNEVRDVVNERGFAGLLIQPGQNTLFGDRHGSLRVVVVRDEDIRVGIAAALIRMRSEGEELPGTEVLLSMLVLGLFMGFGCGVYLAKRE